MSSTWNASTHRKHVVLEVLYMQLVEYDFEVAEFVFHNYSTTMRREVYYNCAK